MRWHWVSVLGLIVAVAALTARAAERPLEFVHALRDRDYHDYALLYLDRLQAKNNLAADLKAVIPFERALVLLDSARSLRDPEEQMRRFDQARASLEEFLKQSPDSPQAAQANSELAQVYIGKGRVEAQQARAAHDPQKKTAAQKKARDYFNEARKVLQAAHDRYKTEYEKHDKSIPKTDKARYEARERVYLSYLQAQLQLAELQYEEAQIYDPGSKENRKLLTEASNAFEQIHIHYRSQNAGLYARMWQGKCFQEQDDIAKALGIYGELLGHGGGSPGPTLKTLQDRVLGFRLICLNHEKKADYQVVIDEASAWIKQNRSLLSTRAALVIQWELVRALEAKALAENTAASEKPRILEQALSTARAVNRYAGEFKAPSTAMIQRIQSALNREPGDPKDFAGAYAAARVLIEDIRNRHQKIDAARGPERERLVGEVQPVLKEAARVLGLALSLATSKDDDNDVNRARYFLAYVYYNLPGHSYDSAVLGEFVARKYHDSQPDLALDAAYLAQAAYIQAYNRMPAHDADQKSIRDADMRHIVALCNFITEHFSASDKAQDARMNLGAMFTQMRQPAEAAKWYLQVPEAAPQYLEAQLAAGGAFWFQYLAESIRPEAERPPREELDRLARQAREILQNAVEKYEAQLPKDITQVDLPRLANLTRAKYTYAQILNGTGDYARAMALLAEGSLSALAAVAAPDGDEQKRPPRPHIKSAEFASLVHQQVLRAAVGLQNLDRARAEMKTLEELEGTDGGGAALTRIYVELGKELQKEVERLQAARDPRLVDVLGSFEKFLEGVFQRKEGRDYNGLMWVAETYRALGDGLESGDAARASSYFAKSAAALQAVLDEEQSRPGYVPAGAMTGVQLRLAMCLRRQKSFAEAEKLVMQILKERPQALDAQAEAAQLYEDWAFRGEASNASRWNKAISGDLRSKKKDKLLWGWSGIAQRLEIGLMQAAEPDSEYAGQFLDARYHVAWCRYHQALVEHDRKQREELLEAAKADVRLTAVAIPDLGGAENWAKFNKLYREVQQTLVDTGLSRRAVVDLERGVRGTTSTNTVEARTPTKKPAQRRQSADIERSPAPRAASGNSLAIWLTIGVLTAGCGAAAFAVLKGRSKPRRLVRDVSPELLASFPSADRKAGTRRGQ